MTEPRFQIKKDKESDSLGRFIIEPLEQGYGSTLGNSLRRVLLTSLPGAAATEVKITGVKHQFSTLEGLKEDVIEFILNLKQVRFKYDGEKPIKLKLEVSGPKEVKASDIETPIEVEVVNKDHVLGSLAGKNNRLKAEITVEKGYGYSPASERKSHKLGLIPVDAAFGPVKKVTPKVESTRVGRRTDLDRLILEVETDGTIKPSEAIKKSAKILVTYFTQIVSPKKAPKVKKEAIMTSVGSLDLTVEELDLPTRIANALRKGGYGTLKELSEASRADLGKVKNLGGKSIKIVEAALSQKGASLKG